MKTKSIIYSFSVLALASVLMFTGCKKQKEFKNENGQSSEDNRTMQSESDAANSDVNDIMASTSLKGKGLSGLNAAGITGSVCGTSIDSSGISNGSFKINFSGVSCNNRTRTGAIRVTLLDFPNKKWKDAGATIRLEFMNYKITRTSDGKSVTLNGNQLVTNVSGTTWVELLFTTHASVVTEIKEDGGVNVTFDDGKTAVYHVNRRVTYAWLNGLRFSCTAEGIGSTDGLSNLENYGTTRDGDSFTSQVTTPIVWNTDCGWWAPVQGAVDVKVQNKEFDLKCTFAVDNKGNPVDVAPNTCAYGWKVEWSYKKKTNKKIIGYL
jgi:hypothetical protein